MNEVKKITLDLTNLKEFENTLEGIDHLLVNINKELKKANQLVNRLALGSQLVPTITLINRDFCTTAWAKENRNG